MYIRKKRKDWTKHVCKIPIKFQICHLTTIKRNTKRPTGRFMKVKLHKEKDKQKSQVGRDKQFIIAEKTTLKS